MRHLRTRLLTAALLALGLAACNDRLSDPGTAARPAPHGPRLFLGGGVPGQDSFTVNSLSNYTIYNTSSAWSISGGYLRADTTAVQSVVIRNGISFQDGYVEAFADSMVDGGLVLRFQSTGNYYLLAIRDDSRYYYANIEMYKAVNGVFTTLGTRQDISWTPGVTKNIRFEAEGNSLKAYVDTALVLSVTDNTFTGAGGIGVRHDNTRTYPGVRGRYDLIKWYNSPLQDTFSSNTLSSYTIYNTTGAWSISGGYLHADTTARQSVVIRNGVTFTKGYVLTTVDSIRDGGLVIRFQSSGNYYLLAIRDDALFGYANLEIYKAVGGAFTSLSGQIDVDFTPGDEHEVAFGANGNVLKAYFDGDVVATVTDNTYSSGGVGLRADNTRGWNNVHSRFDNFVWLLE
ncbi:MAG TPA: hypothetical protein VJT67_15315 [Longimicrobiaceae bacterium]|nr:hypothetical protein [Longimicrobiaceae bacterium]